jgi:hypothetical protein
MLVEEIKLQPGDVSEVDGDDGFNYRDPRFLIWVAMLRVSSDCTTYHNI